MLYNIRYKLSISKNFGELQNILEFVNENRRQFCTCLSASRELCKIGN